MRALAAVPARPAGSSRPLVGLPAAPGPLEADGGRRDDARLLVVSRSESDEHDTTFADLGRFLRPGDVLVVNTSATLPAAVPTEDGRLLHFSSEFPGGLRLVERRDQNGLGSRPFPDAYPGPVGLPGGAQAYLLAPYLGGPRLWLARIDLPGDGNGNGNGDVLAYLAEHGRPIRYGAPARAWPLDAYQTVFAREPGSAEMPSAGRGFTAELVTSLVAGGVVFAPIVLHCGVSSPETGEPPQPERYRVPATTAALVNAARAAGGRVVAVGTTVTRALETTADEGGAVHPGAGWTELVVTPERGVRAVDALITGWHEPEASHLDLIEAVVGRAVVERSYALAAELGYRGHEFGDFHLVLP